MREALLDALRLNLALGAAVLAVLALRAPVRRLFGPRIAYGLWALAPLAAAATLLPARVVVREAPSPDEAWPAAVALTPIPAAPAAPAPDLSPLLLGLWVAGALAALLAVAVSQARFDRAARRGRAGPAVVGLWRPRIVIPRDFAQAYTPEEQRLILAHEATHIRRQDSRVNALVALARCAAWFNPLAHVMARALRIDQEFACDAQVVARHPRLRRAYGETLLKTQLTARPLPFGCHWPAEGAHPLVARVRLLARPRPGAMTHTTGLLLVAAVILGGAGAIWASRPARVVLAPSHEAQILKRLVRAAPRAPAERAPPRTPPIEIAQAGGETHSRAVPANAPTAAPVVPVSIDAAGLQDAKLIPVGDFGPPPRRYAVRGAAEWSQVDPGSAVRVIADMTDDQGARLVTDLTAFGSQSLYRLGYIERHESRLKLFTAVVQHGDRYRVTAALNRFFQPFRSGSIDLAAGETGVIRLPSGQTVNVTVAVRPETPEEIAAATALAGRRAIDVERAPQTAL